MKLSLNFIPMYSNDNNSALVYVMAWYRTGDKLLPKPRRRISLTSYGVTKLQWAKIPYSKTEVWWMTNTDMRRYQMETFSALLALCAGIHRSPVNSPQKGQWRGSLMFSLICTWNGWVNNRKACDLRRHRAHNDVTVMDASMAYCKSAVAPLITHWRYCSFVLSHRHHTPPWKRHETETLLALLAI